MLRPRPADGAPLSSRSNVPKFEGEKVLMKIWKYLSPENVFLGLALSSKDRILRYVADACQHTGIVQNSESIYQGLVLRENMMSTGVGGGIALPHTTCADVEEAAVILIRLAGAVDFEAIDNLPVDIVLALIIPESNRSLHLRILAGISRLCKNADFLNAVRTETDAKKLRDAIENIENHMAFH